MEATVKAVDFGGTKTEVFGVFAGWADQVAFERRFGVNAVVLERLGEAFDDEGRLRPDADATTIRSEWLAFLAWRMLKRGGMAPADFEAWVDELDELEIITKDDEENGGESSEVPTIATAEAPRSS